MGIYSAGWIWAFSCSKSNVFLFRICPLSLSRPESDQGFRQVELVVVFKPFEKLLPECFLRIVPLPFFQVFANVRLCVVYCFVLAPPLRKLVVEFRHFLGLDRVYGDFVLDCLAR